MVEYGYAVIQHGHHNAVKVVLIAVVELRRFAYCRNKHEQLLNVYEATITEIIPRCTSGCHLTQKGLTVPMFIC